MQDEAAICNAMLEWNAYIEDCGCESERGGECVHCREAIGRLQGLAWVLGLDSRHGVHTLSLTLLEFMRERDYAAPKAKGG